MSNESTSAGCGGLIGLIVIFVLCGALISSCLSSSPAIKGKVSYSEALNDKYLRVYMDLRNPSDSTASASCSVIATATDQWGHDTGTGADGFDTGDIRPHKTKELYIDLVITNRAAYDVEDRHIKISC